MNSSEEVKPLPASGTAEVPLLPADAIERIKSKETAQIAAREERRQKRSDAEKLADAVRREELRQIPKANRTVEEQREFARLEARRYRANESKGNTLADVQTAEEFWNANRLLVPAQRLKAWNGLQERVLDILSWMNDGWREPQAPDFVSLDEGLAGIDEHITVHGLIHDDVTTYQHHVLQDFAPSWGVWAKHDIENDPIWGYVPAFFKDAARLKALCDENEPTMVYAKYGIRIGVPAYHLRIFKDRIAEHQRKEHREPDAKCWLCQSERLNGAQS